MVQTFVELHFTLLAATAEEPVPNVNFVPPAAVLKFAPVTVTIVPPR
jgi:hypothetical protein